MNLDKTSLEERIGIAKRKHEGKNCVGTALYLVGEEDLDNYIHPRDVIMSALSKIEEPHIGALAVWTYKPWIIFREEVMHMGVVTGINPTQVTHRPRYGKALIENQSCEEISEGYSSMAKFYIIKT